MSRRFGCTLVEGLLREAVGSPAVGAVVPTSDLRLLREVHGRWQPARIALDRTAAAVASKRHLLASLDTVLIFDT